MTGQAGIGGALAAQSWRMAVWGGAAALLLAPAVAARLTGEMIWDRADFILVGAMLLAICGGWELAFRRTGSRAYAAATIVAAGTAFLLFLVNGAVGFLGGEDNPVNLLFFAMPAILVGGAVVVRGRGEGMARVLAATAGAQFVAGMIGAVLVPDVRGLLAGTALFLPLWLLSAWLFRKAARDRAAG